MELLETQDPEKKKLIETSDRHRRELEKEVSEVSAKTEKMLTNALIIGGTLAVTYFIVSRLSRGSSKKSAKKVKSKPAVAAEEEDDDEADHNSLSSIIGPSLIAQIGTQVINQATVVLLDIAREKLSEYLSTRKDKNENS